MVALLLVTASVAIGLTMASKVVRKRGVAPILARVHEQTALAGARRDRACTARRCSPTHGCIPACRACWCPSRWATGRCSPGSGIIAGYLAALLGLSFYARRRIGAKLWRKLHRATVLVWALGCVHALGAGTDAGSAVAARLHGCDRRPDRRPVRDPGAAQAGAPAPSRSGPGGAGMSDGIVIAGGGLAAQRCTETLRAQGYDGAIRIVCGEPHPPYDRPPLSKELLTGDLPERGLALRPPSWYEERRVDLLLGTRAMRLDPVRRELELSRGRPLRFDALLDSDRKPGAHAPGARGLRQRRGAAHARRRARAASRPGAGKPARRGGRGLHRPRGRVVRDAPSARR